MKRMLLAASMVLLVSSTSFGAEGPCLRYEPAVVHLLGRVVRRTFPGPPNYENIQKGDQPETQALLKLDQPICVLGDPKDELNSEDEHDQRLVTLVPASGMKMASFLGARVRVEGTLFHAITMHHRTPVLITVKRITRVGGPAATKPDADRSR